MHHQTYFANISPTKTNPTLKKCKEMPPEHPQITINSKLKPIFQPSSTSLLIPLNRKLGETRRKWHCLLKYSHLRNSVQAVMFFNKVKKARFGKLWELYCWWIILWFHVLQVQLGRFETKNLPSDVEIGIAGYEGQGWNAETAWSIGGSWILEFGQKLSVNYHNAHFHKLGWSFPSPSPKIGKFFSVCPLWR